MKLVHCSCATLLVLACLTAAPLSAQCLGQPDGTDCGPQPGSDATCLGGVCHEKFCGDTVDNDGDGKTDCADADCNGVECELGPGTGATCSGNVCHETDCVDLDDDDADGCTDAADSDCGGKETGMCTDSTDNDCDGATDCADSDCNGADCGPRPGSDATCTGGACVERFCGDGVDNDGDGKTDCADPDCNGRDCEPGPGTGATCQGSTCVETNCTDGVDNDRNNGFDCNDTADCGCAAGASCNAANGKCTETNCTDGLDNDNDGKVDCADGNCNNKPCEDGLFCTMGDVCTAGACVPGTNPCPGPGQTCDEAQDRCVETDCDDNPPQDEDHDGMPDCADSDCNGLDCAPGAMTGAECMGGVCHESNCKDRLDNDNDGLTDCEDPDCDQCTDPGERCDAGDTYQCQEVNCSDGINNDGDADGTDCLDIDCAGQPCDDGIPCTRNDTVCTAGVCPQGTPDHANCDNGIFCDGAERCVPGSPKADPNGCVDRADPCQGVGETCNEAEDRCQETACTDGVDNDGDGATDCADTADCGCQPGSVCGGNGRCRETNCQDGIDNDGDGKIDCEDRNCDQCTDPGEFCSAITKKCTESACQDNLDNDGDGLKDCADPDCAGTPCNDNTACTSNDMCSGGVCAGTPNDALCADALFCNGMERCVAGLGCTPGTPQCTGPGESCDENADRCVETSCSDGTDNDGDGQTDCRDADCNGKACNDGKACTQNDTCTNSTCSGTPNNNLCDDGVACTTNTCDPARGCVFTPVNSRCDDGVACTDDVCDALRGCMNTPNNGRCDDGVACTDNVCDPQNGCQFVPVNSHCDDNDACTINTCDAITGCQSAPVNCNDFNACTRDSCDRLNGCGHQPISCDDRNACTQDSCDPLRGCQHQDKSASCNDGIACTKDSCDPARGCVFAPVNANCDDGVGCTDDVCDPALGCLNRVNDANCDDGIACTADRCDALNDCQNSPQDALCDDQDACTANTCDVVLGCQSAPVNCSDGNACTVDSCDRLLGCRHSARNCDDRNACTADSCDPARGCLHATRSCDDGVACTKDSCDPAAGCRNVPDDSACSDGVGCTDEQCHPFVGCLSVANSANCDDGFDCTTDRCDPVTDCVHIPFSSKCANGMFCDGSEVCVVGQGCVDSPDPCTNPPGQDCDEANDRCVETDCGDGVDNDGDGAVDCADPDCDRQRCSGDGVACTADVCLAGACRHVPRDQRCDDNLFCTGVETCEPRNPNAQPGTGCVDGPDPCTTPAGQVCSEAQDRCVETACRDAVDNDGDNLTDCADPDCPPASPENCMDGVDNDCNGLTDCADVAVCGPDRDGDGHRAPPCGDDCNDSDPTIHPGRKEDCSTAADDDCDGRPNCSDSDCLFDQDGDGQYALPCGEDCDDHDPSNYSRNKENCADGRDNDCDRRADCADTDCANQACNDLISCTSGDKCTDGVCVGIPNNDQCSDGVFCTRDECIPSLGGCRSTPDSARCDDERFCNGQEACEPENVNHDANGCVDKPDPCPAPLVCNELEDACEGEGGCQADQYEPDDSCSQAMMIQVMETAQSQDHTLCPSGDSDRVMFDVKAGQEYVFFTTGDTDTMGIITNADCTQELARNNDCTASDKNMCLRFVPTFDGRAVLLVRTGTPLLLAVKGDDAALRPRTDAAAGASSGEMDEVAVPEVPLEGGSGGPVTYEAFQATTGAYTLWYQMGPGICAPDGYEPADNVCATAQSIAPTAAPQFQDHTVCPGGDVDRFRFLGVAGTPYDFHTTGGTDTRVEVRSDDCQVLLKASDSCGADPNACLLFTPLVTGFYTVKVQGQTATSSGPYRFHYALATVEGCAPDPAEPDDACSQATAVSVGADEQTFSRSICPGGDGDTFSFEPVMGKVYAFWTTGTTDLRAFLGSEDCGTAFLEETSCGEDPINVCGFYRATSSDVLKLRIEGRHDGVTGNYVLHLQQLDCPVDGWEPDGTCAQATALSVDTTQKSQLHTICPGEEKDLFEFFAVNGRTYHFFTDGTTDTAGAILDDTCSSFLLKDGSCGGTGPNFCLTFTPDRTGMYKLGITGDATGGPYQLFYQELESLEQACISDPREPDDVCVQGTWLTPSATAGSIEGSLCPRDDRDHYIFEAQAGQTYEFRTNGGLDTVGSILGNGCNVLATNDDCRRPGDLNFCLTWTAPADGRYHLRVTGFSPDDTVGAYTLRYRLLATDTPGGQ